jgi:hypothetical protein
LGEGLQLLIVDGQRHPRGKLRSDVLNYRVNLRFSLGVKNGAAIAIDACESDDHAVRFGDPVSNLLVIVTDGDRHCGWVFQEVAEIHDHRLADESHVLKLNAGRGPQREVSRIGVRCCGGKARRHCAFSGRSYCELRHVGLNASADWR